MRGFESAHDTEYAANWGDKERAHQSVEQGILRWCSDSFKEAQKTVASKGYLVQEAVCQTAKRTPCKASHDSAKTA